MRLIYKLLFKSGRRLGYVFFLGCEFLRKFGLIVKYFTSDNYANFYTFALPIWSFLFVLLLIYLCFELWESRDSVPKLGSKLNKLNNSLFWFFFVFIEIDFLIFVFYLFFVYNDGLFGLLEAAGGLYGGVDTLNVLVSFFSVKLWVLVKMLTYDVLTVMIPMGLVIGLLAVLAGWFLVGRHFWKKHK